MKAFLPRLSPGFAAGVFSCLLAVAFVPSFMLPSDSPKWALLALGSIAACALRPKLTLPHLIGGAFLAYAAASLVWTSGPYDGINELAKLIFLAAIFLIGERLADLRPVYVGLAVGFAVNSGVVIAQWLGWDGLPQFAGPAGLFMNKNYLAEAAAMLLVALVGKRLWWCIPGVLPSLLLTGARGALLGVAAAALAWLWTKSRLAAVALLAIGVLAGGFLIARGGGSSMAEREVIWRSTVAGLTMTGSGIGSFYGRFPSHAPDYDTVRLTPGHAHNDLLEMTYELGPGVLLYLALIGLALLGPFGAERLVLIVFLAEGCFGFPLHCPVTAALAALAAGHLCSRRDSLRSRNPVGRWAAFVGMARSAGPRHGATPDWAGTRDLPVRSSV